MGWQRLRLRWGWFRLGWGWFRLGWCWLRLGWGWLRLGRQRLRRGIATATTTSAATTTTIGRRRIDDPDISGGNLPAQPGCAGGYARIVNNPRRANVPVGKGGDIAQLDCRLAGDAGGLGYTNGILGRIVESGGEAIVATLPADDAALVSVFGTRHFAARIGTDYRRVASAAADQATDVKQSGDITAGIYISERGLIRCADQAADVVAGTSRPFHISRGIAA